MMGSFVSTVPETPPNSPEPAHYKRLAGEPTETTQCVVTMRAPRTKPHIALYIQEDDDAAEPDGNNPSSGQDPNKTYPTEDNWADVSRMQTYDADWVVPYIRQFAHRFNPDATNEMLMDVSSLSDALAHACLKDMEAADEHADRTASRQYARFVQDLQWDVLGHLGVLDVGEYFWIRLD